MTPLSFQSKGLGKSLLKFIFLFLILYALFVFWAGWSSTESAIRQLDGMFLLFLSVCCSSNYGWRFLRWNSCLRMLGPRLPLRKNLLIYLSGLAFTVSPGKVAETFRTVFLVREGVEVRKSIACFLADRGSDVLGLTLLGTCLAWYLNDLSWWWILGFFSLVIAAYLFAFIVRKFSSQTPFYIHWTYWPKRWSFKWVQDSLSDWADIWNSPRLVLWVLLAAAAYGIQALMFGLLCQALNISISLPDALFIFVKATLFGAASAIPGGLGVMEGTIIYQLSQHGASPSASIAAALVIRMMTLWLGLLIGLLALAKLTFQKTPSQ
jgi:glycosyltransferase 2 family protein